MKLSNTLFSLLTLFCCYSLPVKDSKADLATDTEIIFDWAEKKFPHFFPFSSAPTQFSDPWLYRYYPLTDVYVGVKTNKEVWVSGNVFGGLMFINPVQELLSTIFMDQQPSFRIKRVLHDLDNNGIPEGITEFSYDNEGYLSNETYTYMDDGTWRRKRDSCLPGPLKEGSVIDTWSEDSNPSHPHDNRFRVKWDDGSESTYLQHGLTLVKTRVKVSHYLQDTSAMGRYKK